MTPDLSDAIASAPMFDGLDRVHAEFLAAQSRPIVLPGGQVLFRRGTPSTGFYVVRDGRMQLSVSNSEGMVKVLEIVSPGGVFGHAVMFLREPYPVDATALVDAHLVFVPAAAVDRVLESDPAPGSPPGREVRRAYSPANVSNWDGQLEFYIRLLPGGTMSEYLSRTATVGDVLTVSSADGEFGLAENGLRPRWFLAGGTGLSPLLSMLRKMAEWGDPQSARLFFGVTHHGEIFGQDEIAALAAALPEFHAETVLWKPDPSWTGPVGNPVDLAAAEIAMAEEMPDVYLCGPPPMMDAAVAALTAAGVPADQIHLERFSTAI